MVAENEVVAEASEKQLCAKLEKLVPTLSTHQHLIMQEFTSYMKALKV